METENTDAKHPQKQPSDTTRNSPASYLIIWLRKLEAAFGVSVPAARRIVYLEALTPFTEIQIEGAVTLAIGRSKFFPTIAELLEAIHETTLARHRQKAQDRNQKILDRPSKPEDWNFKLADAYDELDARAAALWEKDRAFVLNETDHVWPKLSYSGEHNIKGKSLCRCPKCGDETRDLRWVCYDRIMEAKRGVKPKSARELSALLGTLR